LVLTAAAGAADEASAVYSAVRPGLWDEVVSRATLEIEASTEPSPQALYARGLAYSRLSRFGPAERDLAPLGEFAPFPAWPPASEILARTQKVRQLAPEHARDVGTADRVLFRVYHDEDSAWVGAALEVLPTIYDRVSTLYGRAFLGTPVFLFTRRADYEAFLRARAGWSPPKWHTAGGDAAGIVIWEGHLRTPGKSLGRMETWARGTLAHEFGHCVAHRYLGSDPLPPWLGEGVSELCAAFVNPEEFVRWEETMARIIAEGTALPYETLFDPTGFYEAANWQRACAQALEMTRLLCWRIGPEGTSRLFAALRDGKGLDAALKEASGMDSLELYETALGAAQERIRE
ncbi:MAG TPA: hypothetical protein QGH10_08490, partial [Armatimonadota bacterium]|nr:hypothetical protein [Armatimonadota bacterium]